MTNTAPLYGFCAPYFLRNIDYALFKDDKIYIFYQNGDEAVICGKTYQQLSFVKEPLKQKKSKQLTTA